MLFKSKSHWIETLSLEREKKHSNATITVNGPCGTEKCVSLDLKPVRAR